MFGAAVGKRFQGRFKDHVKQLRVNLHYERFPSKILFKDLFQTTFIMYHAYWNSIKDFHDRPGANLSTLATFLSHDDVNLLKISNMLKLYIPFLTISSCDDILCVKSVQIRSFFWSVFSRFWNAEKCGKIQKKKTPYLDTFHAVNLIKEFRPKLIHFCSWIFKIQIADDHFGKKYLYAVHFVNVEASSNTCCYCYLCTWSYILIFILTWKRKQK